MLDARHVSPAGTVLKPREHGVHLFLGALDEDLDPAIFEIAHPTRNADAVRVAFCGVSEADALHIARDECVQSHDLASFGD